MTGDRVVNDSYDIIKFSGESWHGDSSYSQWLRILMAWKEKAVFEEIGVCLEAQEVYARGVREEEKISWVHCIQDDRLSPCLTSGGDDVW